MLEQIGHCIVALITQHPHLAQWIVCLIALSESLPIIGTLVPGSITMTGVGILIGANTLPFTLTLSVAAASAFVGDCLGYYLGYRFQNKIRKLWPFNKYQHWIHKGERFFQRFGSVSIILGRFIGPARSTVPLVAGLLNMRPLRFMLAAFPSALLWALLYLIPGILVGALSLSLGPKKMFEFLLITLSALGLLWISAWGLRILLKKIQGTLEKLCAQQWRQLNITRSTSVWVKLLRNRADVLNGQALVCFCYAFLFALSFIWVAWHVHFHSWILAANGPVFHLLQSLHTPTLNHLLAWITNCGKPEVLLALAILASSVLAWHRQWRAIAVVLTATFIGAGMVFALKHLLFFPRPTGFMHPNLSGSFPSGHATLSIIVYGLLAHILSQGKTKPARLMIQSITLLWLLCILFSRLYFGAHWLTDILGSLCLGFSILFFSRPWLKHPSTTNTLTTPSAAWMIALCAALLVGYNGLRLTRTLSLAQIKIQHHTLTLTQWWSPIRSPYLSPARINRLGQASDTFNVQWAQSLPKIRYFLTQHGWHTSPFKTNFMGFIQRLALHAKQPGTYLITPMHDLMLPALHMWQQSASGHLMTLTLWPSHVFLKPLHTPIWLGLSSNPLQLIALIQHTQTFSTQHSHKLFKIKASL